MILNSGSGGTAAHTVRCGLTLGIFELQRGQVLREYKGNGIVLFVGFKLKCAEKSWGTLEAKWVCSGGKKVGALEEEDLEQLKVPR